MKGLISSEVSKGIPRDQGQCELVKDIPIQNGQAPAVPSALALSLLASPG